MNTFLSSVSINNISLSDTHGAAVDRAKSLYTWGDGTHGQLGEKIDGICARPKKVVMNVPFYVTKVECGRNYTAGINEKNIVFYFGKAHSSDSKGITFLYLDNGVRANEIFCGDNIFAITSQKGELYIYYEPQGLFKVNVTSANKTTPYFSCVKFIDKTFYASTSTNDVIYEFVNYSGYNKPFDIYNYVENQYNMKSSLGLAMLHMPYYVKVLFFTMHCTVSDKERYEKKESRLFNKRKYKISNDKDLSLVNDSKMDNYSLYSGTNTNTNLNITSSSRVNKISTMLGTIFERKIDTIMNNNKILYEKNKNSFLLGKKPIDITKIDYENNIYIDEEEEPNEENGKDIVNKGNGNTDKTVYFLRNESIEEMPQKEGNNYIGLVGSKNSNILENFPVSKFHIASRDNLEECVSDVNSVKSRSKSSSKVVIKSNALLLDKKENEFDKISNIRSVRIDDKEDKERNHSQEQNKYMSSKLNEMNNRIKNINTIKANYEDDDFNKRIDSLIKKTKEHSTNNVIQLKTIKNNTNTSMSVKSIEQSNNSTGVNKMLLKVRDEIQKQKEINEKEERKQEELEEEKKKNIANIHNNILLGNIITNNKGTIKDENPLKNYLLSNNSNTNNYNQTTKVDNVTEENEISNNNHTQMTKLTMKKDLQKEDDNSNRQINSNVINDNVIQTKTKELSPEVVSKKQIISNNDNELTNLQSNKNTLNTMSHNINANTMIHQNTNLNVPTQNIIEEINSKEEIPKNVNNNPNKENTTTSNNIKEFTFRNNIGNKINQKGGVTNEIKENQDTNNQNKENSISLTSKFNESHQLNQDLLSTTNLNLNATNSQNDNTNHKNSISGISSIRSSIKNNSHKENIQNGSFNPENNIQSTQVFNSIYNTQKGNNDVSQNVLEKNDTVNGINQKLLQLKQDLKNNKESSNNNNEVIEESIPEKGEKDNKDIHTEGQVKTMFKSKRKPKEKKQLSNDISDTKDNYTIQNNKEKEKIEHQEDKIDNNKEQKEKSQNLLNNVTQNKKNEPLLIDNQNKEDNLKVVKNKLQKTNSTTTKDNQNNIDYPLSVQKKNTNSQLNNTIGDSNKEKGISSIIEQHKEESKKINNIDNPNQNLNIIKDTDSKFQIDSESETHKTNKVLLVGKIDNSISNNKNIQNDIYEKENPSISLKGTIQSTKKDEENKSEHILSIKDNNNTKNTTDNNKEQSNGQSLFNEVTTNTIQQNKIQIIESLHDKKLTKDIKTDLLNKKNTLNELQKKPSISEKDKEENLLDIINNKNTNEKNKLSSTNEILNVKSKIKEEKEIMNNTTNVNPYNSNQEQLNQIKQIKNNTYYEKKENQELSEFNVNKTKSNTIVQRSSTNNKEKDNLLLNDSKKIIENKNILQNNDETTEKLNSITNNDLTKVNGKNNDIPVDTNPSQMNTISNIVSNNYNKSSTQNDSTKNNFNDESNPNKVSSNDKTKEEIDKSKPTTSHNKNSSNSKHMRRELTIQNTKIENYNDIRIKSDTIVHSKRHSTSNSLGNRYELEDNQDNEINSSVETQNALLQSKSKPTKLVDKYLTNQNQNMIQKSKTITSPQTNILNAYISSAKPKEANKTNASISFKNIKQETQTIQNRSLTLQTINKEDGLTIKSNDSETIKDLIGEINTKEQSNRNRNLLRPNIIKVLEKKNELKQKKKQQQSHLLNANVSHDKPIAIKNISINNNSNTLNTNQPISSNTNSIRKINITTNTSVDNNNVNNNVNTSENSFPIIKGPSIPSTEMNAMSSSSDEENEEQHHHKVTENDDEDDSNELVTAIEDEKISKTKQYKQKVKNKIAIVTNSNNDMDKMITSSNAMKHINKIDTSSSTKKIEFEPKELDDNLLTSLKTENRNNISKTPLPFTMPENEIESNRKDDRLKIDDLKTENPNNEGFITQDIIVDNKIRKAIKVNSKEQLVKILKKKMEEKDNDDDDTSVFYFLEGDFNNLTDIQEEEESLIDSQSNRNKNSQIIKVKNRKVTSVSMNTKETQPQIESTNKIHNDSLDAIVKHNEKIIDDDDNIIEDIDSSNVESNIVSTSFNNFFNNEKTIEQSNMVKYKSQGMFNKGKKNNTISSMSKRFIKSNTISSTPSNTETKSKFLKKQKSIQNTTPTNKAISKTSTFKSHVNTQSKKKPPKTSAIKKKMNIIEQIKHQSTIANMNNNNNSIEDELDINYAKTQGDFYPLKKRNTNPNAFITSNPTTHKLTKDKKKLPFKPTGTISPTKKVNNSLYKTPTFKASPNTTSCPVTNRIKSKNLNNDLLKASNNEEETSFNILKSKYSDFLSQKYNTSNVNIEDNNDDKFLHDLAKNAIPIENDNFLGLKCSDDMREFIIQSVENFKLNQVKSQLRNKKDSSSNIDPTRSNLFGLIEPEYEDKDKSNMLEPMELDKSWISINFRKSFVDSLRNSNSEKVLLTARNSDASLRYNKPPINIISEKNKEEEMSPFKRAKN